MVVAVTPSILSEPDVSTQPSASATGDAAADNAPAPPANASAQSKPSATGEKELAKAGSILGEILALMLMFSVLSIPA